MCKFFRINAIDLLRKNKNDRGYSQMQKRTRTTFKNSNIFCEVVRVKVVVVATLIFFLLKLYFTKKKKQ